MLLMSCGTLSAASQILAPSRQQISQDSQSGQQRGASMLFNKKSLTSSMWHFFSQYLKQFAGMVFPCKPWSWVSVTVRAIFDCEAGEWGLKRSPAFEGRQGPMCPILSDVQYWSMTTKPPIHLWLGASKTMQPFNCFLKISHLLEKITHLCPPYAGTYLIIRRRFKV